MIKLPKKRCIDLRLRQSSIVSRGLPFYVSFSQILPHQYPFTKERTFAIVIGKKERAFERCNGG